MSEATHESSELENNKQLVSNFIEDVLTKHNNIAAGDKYFAQNPTKHNAQVLEQKDSKKPVEDSFKIFQISVQQ
jgi:predicted SnoaL-like aldol condensation-catalyzing enzyme